MKKDTLLTKQQLDLIYYNVLDLFDNLNDEAVGQLFTGDEKDIDSLLDIVIDETASVLGFSSKKFDVPNGIFNHVDKFSELFDEELRKYSLNYFITTTLPEFQLNWHHLEWGNLVQLYNRLSITAARDHGKSYFFSFAYALWKLYRYTTQRNPKEVAYDDYRLSKLGMIITNEFGLAKHLLSLIKSEIENNDILRKRLFPDKADGKWAETEINTRNGATLVIKSFGSKMRGFHPGYIVTDDFMNDSVLYSEEQRQKYITSFNSIVMNMLVPKGQVINVGTPYSTKDLFAYLKSIPKIWRSFEYPAIFPDGKLLWEGRHNIHSIIEKKETQGSLIFSREILVKPVSNESTIFPWSILEKSFKPYKQLVPNAFAIRNKYKRIAIGCDFAISGSIAADYSVFTILGYTEDDKYELLNQYRFQGASYTQQLAKIVQLNTDFSPDVIIMETNGFQSIFAQQGREANLPVVDHTTTGLNKKDLRTGLPGLSILFEQERFILPTGDEYSKNTVETLCIELSSITFTDKGKLESANGHDDTAMSLWLARIGCDYVNKSFDFSFI